MITAKDVFVGARLRPVCDPDIFFVITEVSQTEKNLGLPSVCGFWSHTKRAEKGFLGDPTSWEPTRWTQEDV